MLDMSVDAINHGERYIIGCTLFQKNQSEQFGFVQPVAELIDGRIVGVSRESFCNTMRVFITSHYDELVKNYPDRKFFKLKIRVSERSSENVSPEMACKYVASASDASSIKPKDFFEVIDGELPNANRRIVVPEQIPGTQYIFVNDGKSVYGPFRWRRISNDESSTSIELDFLDAPLPGVSLVQYQSYIIDSSVVKDFVVRDLATSRCIMQGLAVLHNSGAAEYYDYASDEEIVRYCGKISGDQGLRIIERSRLDALATFIRKSPKLDIDLNRKRLARLMEIGEISTAVRDEAVRSVSTFLQSDVGKTIVQGFIENNEGVFIDKIRRERAEEINNQLSELMSEVSKAEERIFELNDKKSKLNEDIQRLNEERESGADLQQVYAKSDDVIKQKTLEIAELDEKIANLSSTHSLMSNIAKLKEEVKYYERKLEDEKDRQEQARQVTKELSAKMLETNSDLQKRMADLKPFVEAINGSFHSVDPVVEQISVPTSDLGSSKSILSRQKEVVQTIEGALAARGRHLKQHQVSNLLITLQQSFLTILAGLPGVGKTSLARLIAETQNIKPRLREVAVSRGWTSQKDLIGYYNPLTSRFQAAGTGMYSFLKAIGEETDPGRAMAFVLLDEANLSPIEHYWSSFMGLTDNEGDRKIILGNETIRIPENLRFIATINYDGTTEPLSPRLINRAPILIIDSPSEQGDFQSLHDLVETALPIPALQMRELFGLASKTPELEAAERAIYEAIKKILLDDDPMFGRPVSISPRKENAIQQYCAKARLLMNVDNDLMALDFAIQQHILPLIQGNGPRFGKRLEKLRATLVGNDLPASERALNRMITFGEADLQTYDFFCW